MQRVDYLVIGAGVSGLSFANAIRDEFRGQGRQAPSVMVLESESEPGGYCRSIRRSGFVWDYSGHFFHFRHPEIESWLRDRMPHQDVLTVTRRSNIWHRGTVIDFPFQKNIHQLPKEDFIDCLVTLFFRDDASGSPDSFRSMVMQRYGSGIASRFLIPYNEKLYACDLDRLDPQAMGRFFPHASVEDIIRNMRDPDPAGYNATFTYPLGGAIEYINALLRDLPPDSIVCDEAAASIDLENRVVRTSRLEIAYDTLVSSAPLVELLRMADVDHAPVFNWNKVIVFNLGFDRKGPEHVHWTYYPDPEICFYRVGFYDNIMGSDRMSLYVEIGAPRDADVDVGSFHQRVMSDLGAVGLVEKHELVDWHHVVLDPAYVHITSASVAESNRVRAELSRYGVHSIGRYGGWRYCSIEDNIVETRALAAQLASQS